MTISSYPPKNEFKHTCLKSQSCRPNVREDLKFVFVSFDYKSQSDYFQIYQNTYEFHVFIC